MATKILIPTPLRPYTDKKDAVDAEGRTVGELLADLTRKHAGLKAHLYNEQGRLRSFVNVYVNDEDIRYLQKEETPVAAGDTISIIPSVAGGVGAVASGSSKAELPALTNDEIKRYSRHLIMPEVGVEGQRKLKAAKVLCIGAGGLGSPVAMYLAAAGVGTLGIVDFDVVDFSNLQRQILHGTPDVGRSKLASAKDRLNALNPNVEIETYEVALSSENALEAVRALRRHRRRHRQFPDALSRERRVRAARQAERVRQHLPVRRPGVGVRDERTGRAIAACIPEPPPPGLVPSCAEGGVLGVLPGVIGTIQATEAIKLILGIGEPLVGRFLIFDALRMKFRELKLRKDPDCPVCGTHPTVTKLIDYEQFCGIVPAAPEPVAVNNATEITAVELKQRLDRGDKLTIVDVREPNEYQINRIAGSVLIPLGDVPKRYDELDPERRDRRPLQDGRPQREGGRLPAVGRVSRRCSTSRAGFSTGSTRSTPASRNIDWSGYGHCENLDKVPDDPGGW